MDVTRVRFSSSAQSSRQADQEAASEMGRAAECTLKLAMANFRIP
jgi:hypothetical protein